MHPKVDTFIANAKRWQPELMALRPILLECGLTEEVKWQQPCYSFNGTNLIIIGEMKDYCVFSFLKGVLLQDEDNVLSAPGKNSQSARILKFTSVQEIVTLEATLKAYIYEAIEVEKAGEKVVFSESKTLDFPQELLHKFTTNSDFQRAFEALTPGRQRGYNLFFTGAKQAKTRQDRIEKHVDRILKGKGINDCVCGLSKRMPNCDGSHKYA
jgi:uncharacterized protein YdeI (YjbR/CyaY-like superfamily)